MEDLFIHGPDGSEVKLQLMGATMGISVDSKVMSDDGVEDTVVVTLSGVPSYAEGEVMVHVQCAFPLEMMGDINDMVGTAAMRVLVRELG